MKFFASVAALWRRLGPAWLVSAVACGPATLITVTSGGAVWGITLLPVVLGSVFFGTVSQLLAAETGVRGGGIVALVRSRIGRPAALLLTLDALAATWLASAVLLASLSELLGTITGTEGPWWGIAVVVLLLAGAGSRGYRFFEMVSKIAVLAVVGAFIAVLGFIDLGELSSMRGPGLAALIGDEKGLLTAAAIMGGAVHISIIAMHTYTVRFRGWGTGERALARTDTLLSMGLFFGLYSLVLFIAAASLFHGRGIVPETPVEIAALLEPLTGRASAGFFLVGLAGAAFSTYYPTVLGGAFLVADQLGMDLDRENPRFRRLLAAGFVVSSLGLFLRGSMMKLLPVMLAAGLAGTPLILGLLLWLLSGPLRRDDRRLNRRPASPLLLAGGFVAMVLSAVLGLRFLAGL